ncbi:flavodoxin domain-containing protein [Streptomyces zhihengii]
MVQVLVLHASAHHSTQEIASRIGERLRTHGHDADVRALDQVTGGHWLDQCDALVLGSAIHNGAWLPLPRPSCVVRCGSCVIGRCGCSASVCPPLCPDLCAVSRTVRSNRVSPNSSTSSALASIDGSPG